ncbi:hypothetical protein HYW72_01700 [Candidatus Nomurabacteria bacterium]|nr:hypothetical protein [Candidatus Nomurabacteria bacterium]
MQKEKNEQLPTPPAQIHECEIESTKPPYKKAPPLMDMEGVPFHFPEGEIDCSLGG